MSSLKPRHCAQTIAENCFAEQRRSSCLAGTQGALQRCCRQLENGDNTLHKLTLSRFNDRVYRVLADQNEHVGNLKFINGVWKFKAIGYEKDGAVIPGGGPLTDRHNTTFGALDEALLNAKLAPDLRNNRSTLERT